MLKDSIDGSLRRWYSALVQRWYGVVVWVLVFAIGLALTATVVPTEHQASGQVLFLPPSQQLLERQPRNPYLALPNGLILTSMLVANSVSSPDVERELADAGSTSTYTVVVVPGTGPLIAVTVKDADADSALALRDDLVGRIEAELDRVQTAEAVPTPQLIQPRRFNVSERSEELTGSRVRAIAAIAVLGLILAVAAVALIERRRGPRSIEPAASRLDGAPPGDRATAPGRDASPGPGDQIETGRIEASRVEASR